MAFGIRTHGRLGAHRTGLREGRSSTNASALCRRRCGPLVIVVVLCLRFRVSSAAAVVTVSRSTCVGDFLIASKGATTRPAPRHTEAEKRSYLFPLRLHTRVLATHVVDDHKRHRRREK